MMAKLASAGISLVQSVFSGQEVNTIMFDAMSYDTVQTMATASPTVLNGVQIAFPSNGLGTPYNVSFGSINFNMGILDGPPADPERYLGLPEMDVQVECGQRLCRLLRLAWPYRHRLFMECRMAPKPDYQS